MVFLSKKNLSILCFVLMSFSFMQARDILLEGKASAFVPSNDTFRDIYGTSGDFGFEITGQIINNLYGFASFDFMSKSGETAFLGSPTKVYTNFFGIGLNRYHLVIFI